MSNYAIEMIKAAAGLLVLIGACGIVLCAPEFAGLFK